MAEDVTPSYYINPRKAKSCITSTKKNTVFCNILIYMTPADTESTTPCFIFYCHQSDSY